jgi:hypothetical protein
MGSTGLQCRLVLNHDQFPYFSSVRFLAKQRVADQADAEAMLPIFS